MKIALPKSVKDNLRFLCVEVDSQLSVLQQYLLSPTTAMARRIMDRSGYSYNLKTRIHSSCINKLAEGKPEGAKRLSLRGAEFIATDLERIAELGRECIKQMSYVGKPELLEPDLFDPMLDRISLGVNQVMDAIDSADTAVALEIGRLEADIDQHYRKLHSEYVRALKSKKQTEDLIQILFVAQSLRQMGDALLHISEAIISANLGQPVNFERYFSLQSLVEEFDGEDDIAIKPLAETRSGSAISGIKSRDDHGDGYLAIFKDGIKRKVKEEKQGVKSWHEIYPGLAPKILSYKKRGQSAALLIEHLPGYTFEQILINEPRQLLDEALKSLAKTLRSVWSETRTPEPVTAGYMDQLKKRIAEVYDVHPEFQQGASRIGGLEIPSLDTLVARAAVLEKELAAPFSVYIHGDFNVDNIIYDPLEKRINFIDLHRSRYMDYVQDVSVFMVSNYRLQILDQRLRQRILATAVTFYQVARRFARKQQDHSFEVRLALGLARSFMTSTRFILDKSLSRSMMLRCRYLLELLLSTDKAQLENFRLPVEEIFSD
jgi:phosphate uptake regulator/aminoglycoside phosphotransferase (APT) family kinase protein